MMNLIRAEFKKISSTRMTYVLFASTIGVTVLYVVMYALLAGYDNGTGQTLPPLTMEMSVRMVYSSLASAHVVVLIFGIVGFTAETRHKTLNFTYLATPQRGKVLSAKFFTHAVWGAIFAIVNTGIGLPLALWLVNSRPHFEIPNQDIINVCVGTFATFVLYSILGVALGALIRNQIAAILISLVWQMLIERLFLAILPNYGKWMPGGAASALVDSRALDGAKYLEPFAGGFLLLGYAVLFAILAVMTSGKKDVA